ncbi:Uncharacterized protein YhaN [Pelagirhabdus alkalitolerans]|uniref:Uncharacterized protein YhaN n=1 Tax=Pelagirhabdus alkalitolerans TaxID=1612202 RepID=A0A1G6NCM9_9BACI|nr:AAA family ATPase [Pelagirhabdus alkalitolerans]SDC65590.1 Uncharacterized protein YhaN [Pelagirhabdus alkalitolerans]
MMRISALYIDRFGKWNDYSLDFNNASIVYISGDNEGGKSTIRQFITFVLFGLSKKETYPFIPENGGTVGGRLRIVDDQGALYTVERYSSPNPSNPTIMDEYNQKVAPEWLHAQLNHIDVSLFHRVFNFDALSIQAYQHLTQDELGEMLLSVGMTGSDRIYQAEKKLRSFLQDQFKPSGRKPRLNQMMEELKTKSSQLNQSKYELENYYELNDSLRNLKMSLSSKQEKSEQTLKRLNDLKEMHRLYPEIEKYLVTQDQLSKYKVDEEIPVDLKDRLIELEEHTDPIYEHITVLSDRIKRQQRELDVLNQKLINEKQYRKLTGIHEMMKKNQQYTQEIYQLDQKINHVQQEIETKRLNMSINDSYDEIESLSLNHTIKEDWDTLQNHFTPIQQEIDQLGKRRANLIDEEKELLSKREQLEPAILSDRKKDHYQQELSHLDQLLYTRDSLEKSESHFLLKKGYIPFAMSGVGIIMIILSATGTGGWYLNGFGLFAIVIGQIFIYVSNLKKDANADINHHLSDQTEYDRINRKESILEALTNHDQMRDQYMLLEQSLKRNQDEQLRVLDQLDRLEAQRDRFQKQIEAYQQQFPFLLTVDPTYWGRMYEDLKELIQQVREYKKQLIKKDSLEIEINEFQSEIKDVFASHIKNSHDSFSNQLMELSTLYTEQMHLRNQIDSIKRGISEDSEEWNEWQSKLRPYHEEIASLYHRVSVKNRDQFINQMNEVIAYRDLKGALTQAQQTIEYYLSEAEQAKIKNGQFMSLTELEQKINEWTHCYQNIQDDIYQIKDQLFDEQSKLKQLEQSKATIDDKHDFYYLKSQFKEKAKEWLTYQIALNKIEETKLHFQTHYLPDVLEEASVYFQQLTQERYDTVYFDTANQQLAVTRFDGLSYELMKLSQGTKDQLYTALRLSISRWLSKHVQLPFIMDDSFVHYDNSRLSELKKILKDFAKDHQLIIFTKKDAFFINQGLTTEEKYMTL